MHAFLVGTYMCGDTVLGLTLNGCHVCVHSTVLNVMMATRSSP